ncbi:MAG: hypothetical protein P8Z81_09890 [Deinococcales bacterium]
MHHRNRLPRRFVLPALVLGLAGALAACNTAVPASSDSSAAGNLALAAVDDAFAGQAAADGTNLAPASVLAAAATQSGGTQSGGTQSGGTQSVAPVIVVRRTDMQRQRRLVDVTVDRNADPITAEVEVWVSITGNAQIIKTYPDTQAPIELLGVKPIAMQGTVSFDLQKGDQGWQLTGISGPGIDQGAYAAAVQSVSFDPDPILIGRTDNVAFASLVEPATSDAFLVVARGRYLRPHGVLADDGVPPDVTAGDQTYSGTVWVGAGARPGAHLAFVTALDYTRTVDVSQTGGSYDNPYTDTLQPVLVQLATE